MSFTIRGNTVFGPIPKEPSVYCFGSFKTYNQKISYTIASLNSDGSDDISFSASNYFWTSSFDIWVQKSVVQSDGKIIVGGRLSRYSSTTINYIGRLNTDGSLDTSFASGTGCNSDVYSLLIQPDSSVIVGGAFTAYNGNSRNRIIRIYSGGTIDPTFTIGTGFNGAIYETKLQSDGKIIVGGDFTSYSGVSRNRIIRLNPDGSIDNTFTIGTGFNGLVNTIEIQSDGKILVGGYFTTYSGITKNYITRLNSDGSIDNTFNSGVGFSNYLKKIYLQSDGKILVGGAFSTYNNNVSQLRLYLMRLNSDGTQDTSFGTAGFGFDNYVNTITQRSDGKIVVGGAFTSYQGNTNNKRGFIILNSDGSIDTSSNVVYGAVPGIYNVLDIQNLSNNKMLISGGFTYFNQSPNSDLILKTDLSGIKDFNFGKTFSTNSIVYSATILPNNRMLLCGGFTSYNGVTKNNIVSLNSDSSIDNTFNVGTGFNNITYTALKQSDNKIIVGGAFTTYSGVSKNRIVRLNSDGSIDDTFNIGTGFNNSVTSLKFQSDGKILVGGDFTSYSGVSKNRIVRLNSDGSIDDTFNIGTGFNNNPFNRSLIDIQTDGKIIVGGTFTSYNGTARNRIVRLNTDGSIDNTFTIGTGFNNNITHLKVLPNDKILVCGNFTSYNGVTRSALVRLNANGTLDTSFNSGNVGVNTGTSLFVTRIAVDRYGRIYASGSFMTYNNTFVYRIMRLNPNGTLDTSFNSGTGFGPSYNNYANDILLLND